MDGEELYLFPTIAAAALESRRGRGSRHSSAPSKESRQEMPSEFRPSSDPVERGEEPRSNGLITPQTAHQDEVTVYYT